jgi:N-methylhydantoinase A
VAAKAAGVPAGAVARRRPVTREPLTGVGVDTGGTFTDFIAVRAGRLEAFKLPSVPAAPERAVLGGLARLEAGADTGVRHGSTVATNTLLERNGARVTLVTTAGFEDLLEIGRQDRPRIYDLAPRRVPPLVPAARRIGAAERRGPRGERWRPLTATEVARVARRVRATRPRAVAISLLHAYADSGHERALERALARLGAPLSRSSELCPEYREYERTATTVTNAYLMPRVGAYLDRLARGARARIEVVLSHGGTAPVAEAAREPVRQLLSGPAGGLAAAHEVARRSGFVRALTLDVGGTSTDVAFLDGALPRRRGREVAGFPVALPLLDVHTVGAGGGSIARVDAGGLLAVGPTSAGADPGPACYGRGGPATVTDALVVLGRLPLTSLAGGALTIDPRAAHAAVAALGRALDGRDAIAAAAGVVRLAEAHIEAALRVVSVERGHDPRGAALVAFGGGGGLHACAVAEAIGCDAVLWPRHAGLLSALGALLGGARREASRTVLLDARDEAAIDRAFTECERAMRVRFASGERGRVRVERWAEVRYRGQSHELSLPGDRGLAERFHREHERRFGFADRDRAVEVVTVEARGALPGIAWPRGVTGRAVQGPRAIGVHDGRGRVTAAWWEDDAIRASTPLRGPAVVTQSGATLWMPRGWIARRDHSGTLVARRSRR